MYYKMNFQVMDFDRLNYIWWPHVNNSTSLVALLTSPTAKSSITADHTNHRKHQLRTDDSLASSYELEEDWEKNMTLQRKFTLN